MTENTYRLGAAQHRLLVEAVRRWICFGKRDGCSLLTAWTGLGTWAVYRPVVNDGLMECVHALHKRPRHPQWWNLTERGVAIVQHWLDKGLIVVKDYEVVQNPPSSGTILGAEEHG